MIFFFLLYIISIDNILIIILSVMTIIVLILIIAFEKNKSQTQGKMKSGELGSLVAVH